MTYVTFHFKNILSGFLALALDAVAVVMSMPKKNQIAIYEHLFKQRVMVFKKDVHMPKHPKLADKNVPNLHIMKAMQSLKSQGIVKEVFLVTFLLVP